MIKLLGFASLLASPLLANAASVQSIDCKYKNPDSPDTVHITLTDEKTGTLFYNTGVEDDIHDQNTGKINLVRTETKLTTVNFEAKWTTVEDGETIAIVFNFEMPKHLLMKADSKFNAHLDSAVIDSSPKTLRANDELTCSSQINTSK